MHKGRHRSSVVSGAYVGGGARPEAGFPPYYSGLAAVAGSNNFEVVDPGAIMLQREKYHLMWWDTAHLAPYGHKLMAEILYEPVARAVRKRLHHGNGSNTNIEERHSGTPPRTITGGRRGPVGRLQ